MTRPLRIAVANWTNRIAGGAERYLNDLIPELCSAGHEIALAAETSQPADRLLIGGAIEDSWCAGIEDRAGLLKELTDWRPDVVFQNGLTDPDLEEALLDIAPAVLLAHSYYGTCVSGTKTWQSISQPCSRPLGAGCLLHYYPHRCGGLNPATMFRQYALQRRRNSFLRRYHAVVTLSEHMRDELVRNGADARHIPLLVRKGGSSPRTRISGAPWRILFAGRLQDLKGGRLLIEAMREVGSRTDALFVLSFVGDGPDRDGWERDASRVSKAVPNLRVVFRGWLEGEALDAEWRRADLFVMPSVWPEPLGLVGGEASGLGIPVVAFGTGAIPEWLRDGVNGRLVAPPASAGALAEAISNIIRTEESYQSAASSAAAEKIVSDFRTHAGGLARLFEQAALSRDR